MPAYSAFTPYGMLAYSAAPPRAQQIYESLRSNLGRKPEIGTLQEGALYAKAMGIARAQLTLERAGSQVDPLQLSPDILPARERELNIVPPLGASLPARRRAVASVLRISRGARWENVVDLLQMAIGEDFLSLRETHASEILRSPISPGPTTGNYRVPNVARKLWLSTKEVSFVGSPRAVTYDVLSGAPTCEVLRVGDRVVVEGGNLDQGEVVTVTATSLPSEPVLSFLATFLFPHSPGVTLSTAPYPYWQSNKRSTLIVVSAAAAGDPERRRKIHRVMASVSRASSTWAIVEPTTPGTLGPFTVGGGLLGVTPLGTIGYP